MMVRRCVALPSTALAGLALAVSSVAHAQVAPTGSHYAMRPSDTGHDGVGPNANGGFSPALPLELPPARGGLPVPLEVVSGTRGFGAAGLGWDIPLSYVLVEQYPRPYASLSVRTDRAVRCRLQRSGTTRPAVVILARAWRAASLFARRPVMALFFPGMSCVFCHTPMQASDDTVTFPPFVSNRADPLFVFSDAVVHSACFVQHPLSSVATHWYAEARARTGPSQRICVVCGELITDPNDYFGTGLLTRVATSPLYAFNFIHLHRSHGPRWSGLEQLRVHLAEAESSGDWRGPTLAVADGAPQWRTRLPPP